MSLEFGECDGERGTVIKPNANTFSGPEASEGRRQPDSDEDDAAAGAAAAAGIVDPGVKARPKGSHPSTACLHLERRLTVRLLLQCRVKDSNAFTRIFQQRVRKRS
jgi:hypothetical protein